MAAVAGLLLVAGTAGAQVPFGLMGYWPLDNNFNDVFSDLEGTEPRFVPD